MALFGQRRQGYKVGFLLILIGFKLAMFGVIAPGWWKFDLFGTSAYSGLWLVCSDHYTSCVHIDLSEAIGLYWATIVLCVSGLIWLGLAYILAILLNCVSRVDTRRKSIERLSIIGGVKLFLGCMMFVGATNQQVFSIPYGPSFDATLVASIMSIVGGILVAAYNQPVVPYTAVTVGATGAVTPQYQYGQPVAQPNNVYYTGTPVNYSQTSMVANASPAAPPSYQHATQYPPVDAKPRF